MNKNILKETLEIANKCLPDQIKKTGVASGLDLTIFTFINKTPTRLLTSDVIEESFLRLWKYLPELTRNNSEPSVSIFNEITKVETFDKKKLSKILSAQLKIKNNFNSDNTRVGSIFIVDDKINIITSKSLNNEFFSIVLNRISTVHKIFGGNSHWELPLEFYNLVDFLLPDIEQKFNMLGKAEYKTHMEEIYASVYAKPITEIVSSNQIPNTIILDMKDGDFEVLCGAEIAKKCSKYIRNISFFNEGNLFKLNVSRALAIKHLANSFKDNVFMTTNLSQALDSSILMAEDEYRTILDGGIPAPFYCVVEKSLTYFLFSIHHNPKSKKLTELVKASFPNTPISNNTSKISITDVESLFKVQAICCKMNIPVYMHVGYSGTDLEEDMNSYVYRGNDVFTFIQKYLPKANDYANIAITHIAGRLFEVKNITSGKSQQWNVISKEETKDFFDFIKNNNVSFEDHTDEVLLSFDNAGAYSVKCISGRCYAITPTIGTPPLTFDFLPPFCVRTQDTITTVTIITGSQGIKVRQLLLTHGYMSKEDKITFENSINTQIDKFQKRLDKSYTHTGNIKINDFLGDNRIEPEQRGCVEYVNTEKKCLIADEPGFGKTWESLAIAAHNNAWPVLIIAPRIGKLSWSFEVKKLVKGKSQVVLGSVAINQRDSERNLIPECDVVIVNYNMLGEFKEDLKNVPFKTIIIDESHYTKHASAQRTEYTHEITAATQPEFLLPMSGSHWENRPYEFWTTIKLLGRQALFGGEENFKKRYCWDTKKKDFSGAINLDELNEISRTHFMIRRQKSGEGKSKWRQAYFPVSELNLTEYNLAEKNFAQYLLSSIKKDIDSLIKKKPELKAERLALITKKVKDNWKSIMENSSSVAQYAKCKQLIGKAKIEPSIELIESFMQQEDKLVVFAHHKIVQKELYEHFLKSDYNITKITSDMSDKERRVAAEDDFLNGDARIIFCSLGAASENINLASSSHVLFIEGTEKPLTQARKRIDRHPQKSKILNGWYMRAIGTIDDHLYNMAEEKLANFTKGSGDQQVDAIEHLDTEHFADVLIKKYL